MTDLIAHELSHFSRYQKKRWVDFWKMFFSLNKKKYVNEERETDKLAIKKGYGNYLIATKREAKKLLKDTKWEKYLDDKFLDVKDVKNYMKKLKK